MKGTIVSERRWIRAIQKGDKGYLQDIAEKYYDDIYRFCAFQTGSRQDAGDLAQETFLRFIKYVEGYHEHNLKGYLLTIAMNVCRNHMRKKGKEKEMLTSLESPWQQEAGKNSGEAGELWYFAESLKDGTWEEKKQAMPEARAVERDVHHRLMEALAMLPETQREAVLCHYLYDMKYREIGQATGAAVSTVKSRVRQGMDKLRDILRKEDFWE